MCVSVLKDKPTPGNPSWGTRVCVAYVCVVCSTLDLGGQVENAKYGNRFRTSVSVLRGFRTPPSVLPFPYSRVRTSAFPYFSVFHLPRPGMVHQERLQ